MFIVLKSKSLYHGDFVVNYLPRDAMEFPTAVWLDGVELVSDVFLPVEKDILS